jgi:hypothetical protein
VRLPGAPVGDLDSRGSAALEQHPRDEALVEQREVPVPARHVTEHDVRSRPHEAAVVATVHRERHLLHAGLGRAALVDRGDEAIPHELRVG